MVEVTLLAGKDHVAPAHCRHCPAICPRLLSITAKEELELEPELEQEEGGEEEEQAQRQRRREGEDKDADKGEVGCSCFGCQREKKV